MDLLKFHLKTNNDISYTVAMIISLYKDKVQRFHKIIHCTLVD